MAHSVEGRFPFLDRDVVDYCNSLPSLFKLPGLNEKNILKRMARDLVPEEIIRRPKQPYRAPDAVSFVAPQIPDFVAEAFSETQLSAAGLFDPLPARRLLQKCAQSAGGDGRVAEFSNVDNMAFVGILSTQLLWKQLLGQPIESRMLNSGGFSVWIDRVHEG